MILKYNSIGDIPPKQTMEGEGTIYFNPKEKYFRVLCGFWISWFFKTTLNSKEKLEARLDYFLPYLKKGYELRFDGGLEPDLIWINLKSTNILDIILEYVERNKIRNKILLQSGDYNFKNNTPKKYHSLLKPTCKFVHFPYKSLDYHFLENRGFSKKFFIAMNRPSKIRIDIFNRITSSSELEESFYYSFNGIGEDSNLKSYPLERYLNKKNDEERYGSHGAHELHKTSFLHLISETFFYKEYEVRFFSEKTFRPILSFQPFVMISHSHTLKKLKEFGFKTFSDWWDESYDEEEDDSKRINKIFELIQHINTKSLDELKNMYISMIPTLQHNFDLLHRDDIDEFLKPRGFFIKKHSDEQELDFKINYKNLRYLM